jgi:hypothetical protein
VLRPGGWYIGREPNFNNPAVRFFVFRWRGTRLHKGQPTPNEYPLRAQEIANAFASSECHCEMHYFWRRIQWLHHPILSVAMSVRGQRPPASSRKSNA